MNVYISRWSAYRAFLLATTMACAGCSFGGSRTRIMEPVAEPVKVSSINVIEGEHSANMTREERQELLERFRNAMYKPGVFAEGQELTVEYRVVLHDPGDQFTRYMIGLGAGEGELIMEAAFRDPQHRLVAKIEASGRLTMGTFGGDFRDAYSRAIKEIVAFSVSNFKSPG